MRGLKTKAIVNISFTADDWQLFDQRGRVTAARKLNAALQKAVNAKDSTESSVWRIMNPTMDALGHLGAADGEAARLVDRVLMIAFTDAQARHP